MKHQIGRVILDGFPRGAVVDDAFLGTARRRDMLPTEAIALWNAVMLRNGRIASRCGFVDRVATGKANPKWIAPFDVNKFFVYFETLPGTFSFVEIATGGGLPSAAWTATQRDTLQQFGPAVPFNNEMCCLLGASIGAYVPATNTMTVLTSGGFPTGARFCCSHGDRMWFASNNYTLEYSQVGTFHAAAAYLSGGAFSLNDQYARINAICSLGRDLFILCDRGIYVLSGYSTSDWYLTKISNDHGLYATSVQTVRAGYVAGIGECVLFVNSGGALCAATRSGVAVIVDKMPGMSVNVTYEESAAFLPESGIYLAHAEKTPTNVMAAAFANFPFGVDAGQRIPISSWDWPGLASASGVMARINAFPVQNSATELRATSAIVWATDTGHVGRSYQVSKNDTFNFAADDYWIGGAAEFYQVGLLITTGPQNDGKTSAKIWNRAEIQVSAPAATGNWTLVKYFGNTRTAGTSTAVAPATILALDLAQTANEFAAVGMQFFGTSASQATAWGHYLELYRIALEYFEATP